MSLRTLILCSAAGIMSFAGVLLATVGSALAQAIPEIQVTGRRMPPAANEPLFATTTVDAAALGRAPGMRLDDVLRAVPGFGLFRRQPSRAAHPTTQGVTLRGLGASGAGRTLVLLDGIPQNDPFGGWIDWSRLPVAAIDQAQITKGGGAGPWGNAALAGVVRLQSRNQMSGAGWFSGRVGSQDTFDAAAGTAFSVARAQIATAVHGHATDGFYLVPAAQRGPADRRAQNRGFGAEARASFAIDDATHATLRASYSEDRLVNGTDPARSHARITDAAGSIVHEQGVDRPAFQVNAYVRDQSFSAVFASIDAGRMAATPVLDQYAVPAHAVGANAIARFPLGNSVSLETGGDVRFVSGTANEYFQNLGQGFLRERNAGGDQWIAGAFAEFTYTPDSRTTVTAAGRVDAWRQYRGRRQESILASGATVRDDRFAPQDGSIANGRFGIRREFADAVAIRAVAYSGFRVPTLNELYRPFRVGNDITEANANLKPERIWGGDLGLEWTPADTISASVTYFRAQLTDSVINITVRSTPGLDPGLGIFVPAGGVLRQRRNLERIRADGLEADVSAGVTETITLTARYLWSRPRVTRSIDQPGLIGNRLAQIPKHQGFIGVALNATERLTIDVQARAASRQFEDDLNERSLDGYFVADLSIGYGITEAATVYVSVENLFNRQVETGVSGDGLLSIGPPRQVAAGLRLAF